MTRTGGIFAGALVIALLLFLPLRLVLALAGDTVSARSVQGTVWNGRLIEASIAGQSLGDLDAGLSLFPILTGKARVKVDGAVLHGAIVTSFAGRGGDIDSLNLPLGMAFGPIRLEALEVSDAHIRYHGNNCTKADGRVSVQFGSVLGAQRLSGTLRCSGTSLAVDLLSQSAMERLSLRFSDPNHYQALLAIRAADTDQATRLAAAGFRETQVGHIIRFSGSF